MIRIGFRFDDPSPTGDHDLEKRVIEIFAQNNVPICAAVIPFRNTKKGTLCLSPKRAGHLIEAKNNGTMEIALHGHSHRRNNCDGNSPSEFAGLALSQQTSLIREGAEHLSEIFGNRITGFVPPWNSYDLSTVEALENAGFDYLSAGWEIIRSHERQLTIVPRTCSLRSVHAAIERALFFHQLSPIIIVVLHPDEFEEFMYPPRPDEPPPFTNLKKLDSLLKWIRSQDRFLAPEPLSKLAQRVTGERRLWHVNEQSWLKSLPYRIYQRLPKHVLMTCPKWQVVAWAIHTGLSR